MYPNIVTSFYGHRQKCVVMQVRFALLNSDVTSESFFFSYKPSLLPNPLKNLYHIRVFHFVSLLSYTIVRTIHVRRKSGFHYHHHYHFITIVINFNFSFDVTWYLSGIDNGNVGTPF